MESGGHLENQASRKILMNLLIFSILILFFVTATGCTKEDANEITLSESMMTFPFAGGEKELIVFSNVKSWTVSSNAADWLTFSPSAGANNGLVKVAASSNTEKLARTATITVDGSSAKSKTVRVTQPITPVIVLSPDRLDFTAAGGVKTLSVNANAQWGSVTSFVNTSVLWFTISPGRGDGNDNIINVTCSPNTSGYYREATIRIYITDLTRSVRVTQER